MNQPTIRLSQAFLDRVASTGLTDAAVAQAIGVTRQYYHQVKSGTVAPSPRFLAGAVIAGLATTLAEIAEVDPAAKAAA